MADVCLLEVLGGTGRWQICVCWKCWEELTSEETVADEEERDVLREETKRKADQIEETSDQPDQAASVPPRQRTQDHSCKKQHKGNFKPLFTSVFAGTENSKTSSPHGCGILAGPPCRIRKGTGSKVDVILNKM